MDGLMLRSAEGATRRAVLQLVMLLLVVVGAGFGWSLPASAIDMNGSWAVIVSDGTTGEVGVGVLSRGLASGSTVPWVQGGVGAIAVLGDVKGEWGPRGLQMLREGKKPQAIADSVRMLEPDFARLQFGILDREGTPGGFTGNLVGGWCGGHLDAGVAAQGNMMSGSDVLIAMYDSSAGDPGVPVAERLLKALRSALALQKGGPPMRSAALLVGRFHPGRPEDASRYVYLRVDDRENPLEELERLYALDVPARIVGARLEYVEYFKKQGGGVGPARTARESSAIRRDIDRAMGDSRVGARELNALAWSLLRDPAYAADAERAVKKARELEPKNPEVLDTAAEIASRAGRADEALRLAKEAFELWPYGEAYKNRVAIFEAAAKKAAKP
jgi:uncharacterized Ntn-hydrolase superfamily protein